MKTLGEWKSQLLHLQESDRAEIAHFLLQSLERSSTEVSNDLDGALARRLAEMRSGESAGMPSEMVFTEIEKRYS